MAVVVTSTSKIVKVASVRSRCGELGSSDAGVGVCAWYVHDVCKAYAWYMHGICVVYACTIAERSAPKLTSKRSLLSALSAEIS